MVINEAALAKFRATIFDFYRKQGRHDLPWRIPDLHGNFNGYKILVSELMLQQTQVPRVIPKYHEFLSRFPTMADLADAPLSEVLTAWSGLGYNRRAKYLHRAGRTLIFKPEPWNYDELVACDGIGPNTAAAIVVYAYDQPITFIETNIRTVYIHHFFKDSQNVADADLKPLIEQTLDRRRPREFYWALMDYGSSLKKQVGNLSKLSKHYAKQSPFQGSLRQVRGAVIRELAGGMRTLDDLRVRIPDERLPGVLKTLQAEGMITKQEKSYHLEGSTQA